MLEFVWIEPVRDWNNISRIVPDRVKSSVNWTCEGLKPKPPEPILDFILQCELNLWGIETLVNLSSARSLLFVWIEPVRDWNKLLKLIEFLLLTVWIEPVRDWNLLPFSHLCPRTRSVNWTCEGLKRWEEERQHIQELCVNWTCEGLKLEVDVNTDLHDDMCELNLWGIETINLATATRSIALCELNLWGIETDIEWRQLSAFAKVWIEPVRDWNWLQYNSTPACSLCELNLWGIETSFELAAPQNRPGVWIEPVRDWNAADDDLTLLLLYCVNWTCEGLKQICYNFLWRN